MFTGTAHISSVVAGGGMGIGMGMGGGVIPGQGSSSSSSSSAMPNIQQQQPQLQPLPNDAAPTMSHGARQTMRLSPVKANDPTRGRVKDGFRRSSLPGNANPNGSANLGQGMLTVEKEKHRQSRIFAEGNSQSPGKRHAPYTIGNPIAVPAAPVFSNQPQPQQVQQVQL